MVVVHAQSMKPWLEIPIVVLVSLLASPCACLVFLLTLQSWPTGGNWNAEVFGVFSLLALVGVLPTGLIWYARRRDRPYRYVEAVLWGMLGYVLCAVGYTAYVVLSSGSALRYSVSPVQTVLSIVGMGFVVCIPVMLTIAPLTVYAWHRAIQTLQGRDTRI